MQRGLDCARHIGIRRERHQRGGGDPCQYLHARPKDGDRLLNQDLILTHIDCMSPKLCFMVIYPRIATRALKVFAAIAKAADLTSATRQPQPTPKTGQVFSDCKKCSRSSQIELTRLR